MGLFDKKYCDVCGEKIGLLGNRKLEDGNLCKNCAKKLSPFFNERRSSTVDEIKQQLAYREENKKALDAFKPDEEFGTSDKILVDTAAKKFVYARNGEWKDPCADVIDFAQVTGVDTDEEEEMMYFDHSDEETGETDTSEIRVVHFHVTIHIDSPYFDKIEVCLSEGEAPTPDGDENDTAKFNEFKRQMNRIAELLG